MTILDEIIANKHIELANLPKLDSVNVSNRKPRSLFKTFKENANMNIIAEIKRASPSKGDINITVNIKEQAKAYVENGAGAISVLTDVTYFKGTMDDLRNVRDVVNVPILCKDFIIDRRQIDIAKNAGADVILLIVAALTKARLTNLFNYARLHDLDVLVEVHDEEELSVALDLGAKIIGINNRNLHTFEVDLNVTERLASLVNKNEIVIISESGFSTGEDVAKVANAGAEGILVGETLMKATDLKEKMQELQVLKGTKQ
ncbi:indole-3-glycerol-phosphate synthase [Lottiidibacillus patelloidae]|uniref:Indole-3-glycerol phosphate synthase n=1 Tax=Lottiidibacillus patelloidae TaxID=2670334 RepID=A0A263BWH9_9BACI|nr:indole-3-glycerol phosphate synthase TrpC [Lottiidibacillus patelloidae]OZM58101.1 indole-3-glycerol-phosphate synthase [Lottiidibacillus patelloidae]